jgi:hypothetical protein
MKLILNKKLKKVDIGPWSNIRGTGQMQIWGKEQEDRPTRLLSAFQKGNDDFV